MLNQNDFAQYLAESRRQRELTVWRDGSPMYRHTFGAIAATANEYVEMATTFPRSRAYEPLNSLVITNNSAADLDVEINGRDYALSVASTIMAVTDQAIWSFRLTNNDAVAAAAGTVRANINRPPLGADEMARLRLVGEAPF